MQKSRYVRGKGGGGKRKNKNSYLRFIRQIGGSIHFKIGLNIKFHHRGHGEHRGINKNNLPQINRFHR